MTVNYQKNRESIKKYQDKNRDKLKEYYKEHHRKLKEKVLINYGKKCTCCGEKNIHFLTLDHINNDGYKTKGKTGKRIVGTTMYRHLIREKYPSGIQTLCFNCNIGKQLHNGICPHKLLKLTKKNNVS